MTKIGFILHSLCNLQNISKARFLIAFNDTALLILNFLQFVLYFHNPTLSSQINQQLQSYCWR